jgi:hypothetical protein
MRRWLFLALFLFLPTLASGQTCTVNLTQLRTEITNNPLGLTDAGITGGSGQTMTQAYTAGFDGIVVGILNLKRASISVTRSDVTPQEVIEAIQIGQLTSGANASIAALQGAWLNGFFGLSAVRLLNPNGTDTRVLTNLLAILTNGSSSETRLRALGSRQGSRVEQLFCEFLSITDQTIVQVRQLP